ncbi:hypothetical protein LOAG_00951 [Loa loa]|uniref:Uncharacterized protein n=1 Tax=Loa loa TaxID=7209 RepID=A0A1S0UC82_LOALO|nr:hypothetical protein LOAG_00951 [Loa loa]EFO27537.1 hypothetical protein LOAG_00951 [Loa loa]
MNTLWFEMRIRPRKFLFSPSNFQVRRVRNINFIAVSALRGFVLKIMISPLLCNLPAAITITATFTTAIVICEFSDSLLVKLSIMITLFYGEKKYALQNMVQVEKICLKNGRGNIMLSSNLEYSDK